MTRLDLAALRNRGFRVLGVSQIVSVFGDQVLTVAVTIAVLDSGGDATALGVVLACRGVGLVLFLLVGGVWGDRMPRRRVLVVAYLVQAAAVGALVVAPRVWVLGAVIFLAGVLEAFIRPAFNAVLGAVLREDERVSGRALVSIAIRTAIIAGPGLSVVIASVVGTRVAFCVAIAAFAGTALLLRGLDEPELPKSDGRLGRDIVAGLAAVRERRWVLVMMVFTAVELMFTVAPSQVLLPVISRQVTGGDGVYGTALVCFGVGGLAGGLATMLWRPRVPLLALMAYGLIPLSLLFFPADWVVFGAFLLAGVGIEVFAIRWDVALQRAVPGELLGRVSSVAWLCSFGLMPFGLALTGPLVGLVGTSAVLAVAAALVLAVPPMLVRIEGMKRW
ncbi:MFS transporter [Nonomuraea sediminis]|uniref:MFS transporter n=1 Tax=Nonomuraea sediminis TaxID=2835864 RepID=UPI0027E0B074|nr:MFS transporter [Nonomuraea sediminis]